MRPYLLATRRVSQFATLRIDRAHHSQQVLALLVAGLVTLGLLLVQVHRPVASHNTASFKQQLASNSNPTSQATSEKAAAAYAKLPLNFIKNTGQVDGAVRYYAQGAGFSLAFARDKATLSLLTASSSSIRPELKSSEVTTSPDVLRASGMTLALGFLGANPEPTVIGETPAAGKVNYLIGNDSTKWRTGLSTYHKVVYRELWPGIDMVFHGAGGTLKYEFLVRPGAHVEDIALAYRGAQGLALDPAGNLTIHTPLGLLKDSRPMSYQQLGAQQVPVQSRFVLRPNSSGSTQFGFAVGSGYDRRRVLVIDPGLVYSTFLGGTSQDVGIGIALDPNRNAYVTGHTFSPDFPTTPGAFDNTHNGFIDAFVTKLNASGSALVYSTFLGGVAQDQGQSIAVDSRGNAYITGYAQSPDFPTTPGAFDPTHNGTFDAFVTKLNASGSTLVYSTFLGGATFEGGNGITLEPNGNSNAYVTGITDSANFPTTPGAFDPTHNGAEDVFVTKLNAGGSALVYSTFVGGAASDDGRSVAVEPSGSASGNAYVTGHTASPNFPTTPGAFDPTQNGTLDAFVTKLNASGSALVYSTFLGGTATDQGFSVAVRPGGTASGNAYVTGVTSSPNFPTTPGAFDPTYNGTSDVFVTRLNASGSALVYSTFLGGAVEEVGLGLVVDPDGDGYVTGLTSSPDFPTTPGAFDNTHNGDFDAYMAKLTADGSALVYSTFLGGTTFDSGNGIAVDPSENAYVTGGTTSPDFPTTPGAFDNTHNGDFDAFITKLPT
jgi:hypothetical protein